MAEHGFTLQCEGSVLYGLCRHCAQNAPQPEQGIPAVVIGKATADNDRVVINEDERRFLEPLRAGVQVYGMEFKI